MSKYYTPKRTRNIFDPKSQTPFSISRSKIDLFFECKRCFYIDRKLGVGRPPGFPFTLNSAVDKLLKKEFDIYRNKKESHPLVKAYGIKAIPFSHNDLDKWRENFVGVQYKDEKTNLIITGAIDDVWINENGELHVVDYKATSKDTEVNLDQEWQDGYKRQMEIYIWLLRRNGHKVSDTGYFVYVNGLTDKVAFDAKLEFDVKIISYKGNDSWVYDKIVEAKNCLMEDRIPESGKECDYCAYINAINENTKSKTLPNKTLW